MKDVFEGSELFPPKFRTGLKHVNDLTYTVTHNIFKKTA